LPEATLPISRRQRYRHRCLRCRPRPYALSGLPADHKQLQPRLRF